ncbi:MAG TPA: sensor histidine kinase [Candidatus Acidoferrales bacterium]|nr:sensor histidine kinase [Candidatus Acidoferrales bacterium]
MADQKGNAAMGSGTKGWRELRSRMALVGGFGTLLTLMAFVCVDSLHTLENFETANLQIRQEFLNREQAINQVRGGVYESANITSEYILNDSNPEAQESLRNDLQSVRSETTAALQACIQSLPAERREPFQQLATELEHYWSTTDAILALDSQKQTRHGDFFLHGDLLSRNAAILTITKDLSALNSDELNEAERGVVEISAQFRRRLLTVVSFSLSFGLILAAATIGYAGRLENRLKQKYAESLQAQRELKELSKRLVDTEERERRAISRELHDEVGQSLSALLLEIENIRNAPADGASLRRRLDKIKVLAEECLNEIRDMALLLRPSMLDDLGLIPALEWQGREVSKRTGMFVETIEENVSDNLPDEHRTCVYRIVQEALNNCSKHAYAKNVRVVVRQELSHLRVSIEDDGRGFESQRVRGLGLVGMNERVTQLGGTLKVDSDPGRGTRIEVELPLPDEQIHRKGLSV